MGKQTPEPKTVEAAVRELKILLTVSMDKRFPDELRPMLMREYKAAEITLARLIQDRGDAVEFIY